MITPSHDLPVSRQAKVPSVSRGAVYYKAWPVPPRDLSIMRWIDELHLERPFAGAGMPRDILNREGVNVGRRHVATLMKRMGIVAIYLLRLAAVRRQRNAQQCRIFECR
jgi:putative transposase